MWINISTIAVIIEYETEIKVMCGPALEIEKKLSR